MCTLDFGRPERVEEARFALVKALRVERIAQVEERVIEVMAELVEERAEKRPEGDHLASLRGEHPDRDDVAAAPVAGGVEPLELATAERRSPIRDEHAHRRNAERRADAVADPLCERLDVARPSGCEHAGQRGHGTAQRRTRLERHAGNTIARCGDALEPGRKPPVPCRPWTGSTRGGHGSADITARASRRPLIFLQATR